MKRMTDAQVAEVQAIKERLRVTKVVATRAVKTKRGDFFVGMSAAWDTRQEDAGGMGTDLVDAMGDGDIVTAFSQQGMTMREARIAACILGMQVDIQAHRHAMAGGAIPEYDFREAEKAIQRNYMVLVTEITEGPKNGNGGK